MKKIATKQLLTAMFFSLSSIVITKAQAPIYSEIFSNTNSLGTCTSVNSSSGAWVWSNSCSASSYPGHSTGGHAYFLGSGSTCQYGSGGSTVSGDLRTPTIFIPPTGGAISFNYYLNNECGLGGYTCSYDILKMQISTNGGSSFTDIMSSGTGPQIVTSSTSSWTTVSYTLPATYNNQNIIINFNFNSQDGIGNTYDGIYIDDIAVTGFCTPPSVSISASADTICQGLPVTLTAGGTAISYSLTTLGSLTNTVANTPVLQTPLMNTTYVMLGADAAGCVGIAQQSVYVVQAPTVNISFVYPTTICSGNAAVITVNGATNYTLDPGGMAFTGSTYSVFPSVTTDFTLVGTDNSGCLSYNSVVQTISVNPTPVISIDNATICAGSSFTMYPTGGANYVFSNGSAIVTPPVGMYSYTINSTVDGCSALPVVCSLTVYSMPNTAILVTKTNVCKGIPITLRGSGAQNYQWNTGSTPTASVNVVTPNTTGTIVYSLTGTNEGGCAKTATVSLIVDPCLGVKEMVENNDFIMVYPNPNNGKFTVEMDNNSLEKSIKLFDLTGRILMTLTTAEPKIDININQLSKGIYYLQVQAGSQIQSTKIIKE